MLEIGGEGARRAVRGVRHTVRIPPAATDGVASRGSAPPSPCGARGALLPRGPWPTTLLPMARRWTRPTGRRFRSTGHRMLDDMIDFLRDVRARPAWRQPAGEARSARATPLPEGPTPLGAIYDDFRVAILPFRHREHPPGLRRLGARKRDADGDAGRDARGGDELQRRRPRARGRVRGAAGDRLVSRALPVSGRGERPPGYGHLHGQPHRRGGRAHSPARRRGARPRASGAPRLTAYAARSAHGLRRQGDGDRRPRRRRAAPPAPSTPARRLDLAALAQAIADDRAPGRRRS